MHKLISMMPRIHGVSVNHNSAITMLEQYTRVQNILCVINVSSQCRYHTFLVSYLCEDTGSLSLFVQNMPSLVSVAKTHFHSLETAHIPIGWYLISSASMYWLLFCTPWITPNITALSCFLSGEAVNITTKPRMRLKSPVTVCSG